VYFGWPKSHFVGVVVAGFNNAITVVAKLGLIITEAQ
jgi:hypothetical protein